MSGFIHFYVYGFFSSKYHLFNIVSFWYFGTWSNGIIALNNKLGELFKEALFDIFLY